MAREIVLDTETTGLDARGGHRLIEIACIELDDLIPTGKSFHRYIHPEREIDFDAQRVHGISLAFLADKPKFGDLDVVEAFLEFIGEATLVAHNAAFDATSSIQSWSGLAARRCTSAAGSTPWAWRKSAIRACTTPWTPSVSASRSHSASARSTAPWSTPSCSPACTWSCQGGRERGFDLSVNGTRSSTQAGIAATARDYGPRPRPLVARLTEAEHLLHVAFIRDALKDAAVCGCSSRNSAWRPKAEFLSPDKPRRRSLSLSGRARSIASGLLARAPAARSFSQRRCYRQLYAERNLLAKPAALQVP